MPKESSGLYIKFANKLKNANHTRIKIEHLFSEGHLVRRDLDFVYKSLFISIVSQFEEYLELYFAGLLCGEINNPKAKGHVSFRSKAKCLEVLKGTRQYMSWLPYDQTIKYANIYFKDGRPFAHVTEAHKRVLVEISTLRNVFAHGSSYATDKFKRMISTKLLTTPEKKPVGYLRGLHSSTHPTRYEYYSTTLLGIFSNLCN